MSRSPASAAWCISRARSGFSDARSAPTTPAFSTRRFNAGSRCSTARRAISCRNCSPCGPATITPASSASASARCCGPTGTGDGTTESSSSAARHSALSRPTRASTASVTDAGTCPTGAASTSVTKNGLPPVTRCSAAPSFPANDPTAERESGASCQSLMATLATTPSSRCSAGCASSRKVSTSTAPSGSIRRAA